MDSKCKHHKRFHDDDAIECDLKGKVPTVACFGCSEFASRCSSAEGVPCKHRGIKLSVASCCGQMYACNKFKGKKCAATGVAKDPFLSCQSCAEFESTAPIETSVRAKCTAVTSLNPDPVRKERQRKCIESWIAVGLDVLVVNQAGELDSMSWLNGIAEQFVSTEVAIGYDRPVQKVHSMIRAGMLTGDQFMLINSDIEIAGNVAILSDAIESTERLTIGVRRNHSKGCSVKSGVIEPAGLDVFVMSPQLAATVPCLPFGIGKPAWDYWLPHHFRAAAVKFNWIQRPLFFHESHAVGWSASDWDRGHDLIMDHYGISIAGNFRSELQKW